MNRPTAMLRRGRYKLMFSLGDPAALFDVEEDRDEMCDLLLLAQGLEGRRRVAAAG